MGNAQIHRNVWKRGFLFREKCVAVINPFEEINKVRKKLEIKGDINSC